MSSTITALPFFAGEMDSFDPLDTVVVENTGGSSGTNFDPTLSRCCIDVPAFSPGATTPKWPEAATLWMYGYINGLGTDLPDTSSSSVLLFLDNSGTTVAQLRVIRENLVTKSYRLYTLQAGVLTLVTQRDGLAQHAQRVNIKLVAGAAGVAALYIAGELVSEVTGLNHAGWTGVAQYKLLGGINIGGHCYFSQIIAKATSTLNNFVKTDRLDTESGAPNNAWVGGVGDINEIIYNDATFIYTPTANDISTFYDSTLDLLTYSILGRGVGARAVVEGAGPTQIQLVLESAGTNYFSTSKTLATGNQAYFNSWVTDPNGSIAWTVAAAEVTKGGVKAIA